MSERWRYEDENGKRLAMLTLDAPPPIGWPVAMVGPEMGPVRHYNVIAVKHDTKTLVLSSPAIHEE